MTRKPADDPHVPGESRRRKSLGRAGESVARVYLEMKGYRILQANYSRRSGEVDIIAYGERTIVFCEVKTRLGERGAFAAVEGYSETQQRRMVAISEEYLAENAETLPKEFDLRYDLILVGDGPGGVLKVRDHIEDAFRPQ